MAERYFSKFPKINYANSVVVNIMERAVVYNSALNNPNYYYPYDIQQGQRADQISDAVYSDQYLSWLTYLSNSVVDPYYDWYLSNYDMNNFVTTKYNTDIPTLQSKIKFYRNNWYNSPGSISVNQYLLLDSSLHKFYEPVYNNYGAVQGYTRKQIDWTINTNSILNYSAVGTNFVSGELVSIHYGSNTGTAEIVTSNNTNILVKNVSGYYYANVSGTTYIYGKTSTSNVTFTAVSYVANNIPSLELSYWDPVTVYDYENEQNEYNRTIRLATKSIAVPLSKQLKNILNG
jgi:hypothetical protein